MKKNKPEQPMIRYQVEWCHHMPFDESGDSDVDNAKYSTSNFDELNKAIEFSVLLLKNKKDAFGSVLIEEQQREFDQDMFEHEDRYVWKWAGLRDMRVDDLEYKYGEKDLERIDR